MSDLQQLLAELRDAHEKGPDALDSVVRASAERLSNDDYRQRMVAQLREVLTPSVVTMLLVDEGILSSESVATGVLRRLGANFAPAPDLPLHAIWETIDHRAAAAITAVSDEQLAAWFAALSADRDDDKPAGIAVSMVILATRIAGAGLEARLLERLPSLTEWGSPFVRLSRVADQFAGLYLKGEHAAHLDEMREIVDRCLIQVADFRIRKQELGTTLYLSSASLRMLQQLRRLRHLVHTTTEADRASALAAMTKDICGSRSRRFPTIHFLDEKLELVAYLAVGHAARKGEKYAVRAREEYWGFWRKSLFGGLIVAIFGSAKLHLEVNGLAIAPQALVYGLNYALCFVLIYVFGASLATKQPAFTASRLAESLEEGPDHESFPELVRAIWRSQLVSFLGNILGAATCSLLLVLAYVELTGTPFVELEKAQYLLDKMHPWQSASIWYAAIAGVMLSIAGFFAGFIDNAIVFHRVADRVRAQRGVFRFMPRTVANWLAERIDHQTGAMASNLMLGFLLGSAGAIGLIFGLPFDIRHVAFASSHTAISLFYLQATSLAFIATAALGVVLIGFINFVVSFGLTLAVAVQARRVAGADWRSGFAGVFALFRQDPLGFLLPVPPAAAAVDSKDSAEEAS